MNKEQALNAFWNSFGIPAYAENNVPKDTPFPYITYQVVTDSFANEVLTAVSIYDKNIQQHSSLQFLAEKTAQISNVIGEGGYTASCEEGLLWIQRGQPFAQTLSDDSDQNIKRKLLNVTITYATDN